jgi:uncharacterized membrane protein YkgB
LQIQTPSLNPMNQKNSNNTKSGPKFHYNLFHLNEFSRNFCFQWLLHYKLKHYETNLIHPYSLKTFQGHQEHDKTHHGLGDFNVTNKSNKLLSFTDKYWRFSNTISEEKNLMKITILIFDFMCVVKNIKRWLKICSSYLVCSQLNSVKSS